MGIKIDVQLVSLYRLPGILHRVNHAINYNPGAKQNHGRVRGNGMGCLGYGFRLGKNFLLFPAAQ